MHNAIFKVLDKMFGIVPKKGKKENNKYTKHKIQISFIRTTCKRQGYKNAHNNIPFRNLYIYVRQNVFVFL